MSYRGNLRKILRRSNANRLPNTRIIAVAFAAIILLGAALLMLPVASRDGLSCGPMKALFTATSATCVTGLILADTYVQWSGFGQAVIICLIQIGGLGFMSIVSVFAFTLRKRVGMKQRLLLAQTFSLNDAADVVRLQKHVLVGAFSLEGIGALVLLLRFLPEYGFWTSLKWALFHSVSAFCNAGFDIFGVLEPGSSLALFQTDYVVCITIMLLIQLGGLGFFVWEEVYQWVVSRGKTHLSVYSKLVLISTLVLFLVGTALIGSFEWNNPDTLGTMAWHEKLLASAFQSTTFRTAGFAALNQGALLESTKATGVVLMLIGGSSGSTAGGLKTVTVLVLLTAAISSARGHSQVRLMKRTVNNRQVSDAMSLTVTVVTLCFAGAIFLTANSGVPFIDAIYETASALATVGLTANITPMLHTASKVLLIVFMYFGRVGVLTLSLGFLMGNQAEERFRYAETRLLIG